MWWHQTVWGICSWQNRYLNLVWHICKYFWGNIQFSRYFRPKKHPKIITSPLNKCNILKTCLLPLQYIIKFSLKLLLKLCFGNFQILLGLCSFFLIFAFQKPLKILTGLWKRCDVCQNYLSYWKYMLRVLKKLLVNLFMLYLLIFLRLHSVLTVFFPQGTQKSSQVP